MHTEHLDSCVRIFLVGFGGVFLNLALLMCAVKVIGWSVRRVESNRTNNDGKDTDKK